MTPPSAPSAPGGNQAQIRQDVGGAADGIGGWNSLKIWEDQFDKLKQLVDSMNPGKVRTAGEKYSGLAEAMNNTVGLLHNQSYKIIEAWGGRDAQLAMEQMNKAYRAALEIQEKSSATGTALKLHADTQTQWQQAYGSGSPTDSWVREVVRWAGGPVPGNVVAGFLANNLGAGEAMHQVNVGTEQSNDRFPEGIRQDMPTTRNPSIDEIDQPEYPGGPGGPGSPKMPGGGPPPGGPNGMPPGGPGAPELGGPNGPGGPNVPGGPNGPGGPGGPNIPGPGGPGTPGGPDFPGGGPGGPGSDLASMPGGGPGGGPGGLPGGAPGLGGGAPGGGLPGGAPGAGALGSAGAPGAFAGPGAFGKNGLGGAGGPMGMPMGAGAGAGGGQNNERERSTWLTEDEDVWGGNDETAPPVIG